MNFKVDFREKKKVVQIADTDIKEWIKKVISWFKESSSEGFVFKRVFSKFDDNFVPELAKYLCWYFQDQLDLFIDDVEVVLEGDLQKFLTDQDYANEVTEENNDTLPDIGIKFWQIPFEHFIDEENAEGFWEEVHKIIGD